MTKQKKFSNYAELFYLYTTLYYSILLPNTLYFLPLRIIII